MMVRTANQPRRMRFASLRESDRVLYARAVHEAAHGLAIVVLGGTLHSAEVFDTPRNGRGGETRPTAAMDPDRWRTVLAAGPYAEAKLYADGRTPSARLIRAVLRGPGCEDDRALIADGAPPPLDAAPLVDRCFDAIERLALSIRLRGAADHRDALGALGLDAETAEHGLALIRGGSAPRSFKVTAAA